MKLKAVFENKKHNRIIDISNIDAVSVQEDCILLHCNDKIRIVHFDKYRLIYIGL